MADPISKERTVIDQPAAVGRTRYEDDPCSWALEQCAFLQKGQFDQLDIVNLEDEVGDVARREYDELRSALENLLMHMLKWDHQPERRTRGWSLAIEEQRLRVEHGLGDNPGLRPRRSEAVEEAFRLGRLRAAREMGVDPRSLPTACPYDWDTITTRPFATDQS